MKLKIFQWCQLVLSLGGGSQNKQTEVQEGDIYLAPMSTDIIKLNKVFLKYEASFLKTKGEWKQGENKGRKFYVFKN